MIAVEAMSLEAALFPSSINGLPGPAARWAVPAPGSGVVPKWLVLQPTAAMVSIEPRSITLLRLLSFIFWVFRVTGYFLFSPIGL